MSAIAAINSTATNAIASLLSNAATAAGTPATGAASPPASVSGNPTDILDLSDNAKATLARAKVDQVAADKLAAQVDAATPGGKATASKASGGTSLFDKLSGRAQAGAPSNAVEGFVQSGKTLGDSVSAQVEAHRQPDGTVTSFTQTFNDVSFAPSTPQAIDNWYQTEGQSAIKFAQQDPSGSQLAIDDAALAQAVQSHSVTIQNAKDIPGLNFHNTLTIQGGEGGASNSWSSTYNRNAAIFSDPTTSYRVSDDGTVISWKTPPANVTAPSIG
jgi:hypothetical protein